MRHAIRHPCCWIRPGDRRVRLVLRSVRAAVLDQTSACRRQALGIHILSVAGAVMNFMVSTSMADLDGRQYRAVRRLSTKGDLTLAEPGETCERVPAESLPWLLSEGKIVPVNQISEAEWGDLWRPEGQG